MGADQRRVKVRGSSLRAKATTLTENYPTMSTSAVPPCMLSISGQAMQKLDQNYQQLVGALAAGEAEAARLGACLQAAGDAYDKADAEAQAAIHAGGPSGGGAVPVNPNLPPTAPPIPLGQSTLPPEDDGVNWEIAVQQFDSGDQGSSLHDFSQALLKLADQMVDHGKNFSMGDTHWEGSAAEAAEGALRRHESWLYDLAVQTRELASQADNFASTHTAEHANHPTEQDVAAVSAMSGANWMNAYALMQEQSDEVRKSYASKVDFPDMMFKEPPAGAYPSAPVDPKDVASTADLKEAIEKKEKPTGGGTGGAGTGGGGTGGGGGGQPSGGSPQEASPSTNPAAAQEQPQESGGEKPGGGSGGGSPSGSEGGGSPSGGEGAGAGGGLPGGLGDGLGDGTGLGSGLPDDGGLKPASTGGGAGGGGAGGGGLGGQPLQPAASAPAMSTSAASTGAGPGGAGGGGTGGGAMGGGMGGGMGGMGHGNREGGKEKKRNPNLSPEESLYVEDRPYTDPVIGHTRRTKIGDKKETK